MSAPPVRAQPAIPVFDQLRATVTPGAHIVVRLPGVLMVIRRAGRAADDVVPALLELCRDVTGAAPRSPGRTLARRLTGWLAQHEQAPGFGTLAATEDGVAVFLYGEVTAWAEGLELSGSTAAFTVDRLVEWPSGPLMLAADGITIGEPTAPPWVGLHRGVLEGGGLTLHPDRDQAWGAAPAAPPSAAAETDLALPATPAPPDPEVSGVLPPPPRSPVVSDQIFGVAPDGAPRAPLPVSAAPPPERPEPMSGPGPSSAGPTAAPPTGFLPSAPAVAEGATVLGYRCSRGHHNDPRVSFCAHCGIRMDQLTGVLVRGRRPPLGLVVLDTGSTFVLDDDYLLGRDPDNDPEVRAGRLRALRLDDNSGTMSRAHLEIRLQGWDVAVVDRGSANGTYVAAHGQQGWSAVVPRQPFVLSAGHPGRGRPADLHLRVPARPRVALDPDKVRQTVSTCRAVALVTVVRAGLRSAVPLLLVVLGHKAAAAFHRDGRGGEPDEDDDSQGRGSAPDHVCQLLHGAAVAAPRPLRPLRDRGLTGSLR